MPNWCDNVVTFKHDDPKKIKDIVRAWNKGALMSAFFPCPEELNDTEMGGFSGDSDYIKQAHAEKENSNLQTYGYKNWYDWRVAEWGTKWDVGRRDDGPRISVKADATKVKIRFSSAWSPPTGFYEKMRDEQNYEIEAYFFEPGMGFCGSWRNGVVADFSLTDIKTVNDLQATIPAKIIRLFKIDTMIAEQIEDT